MIAALEAYLDQVSETGDHHRGVVAAAEAVAERPWEVVRSAGLLARCRLEFAPKDQGLTRTLETTHPSGQRAVLTVEEGQPYPVLDHVERRSRGAFDVPVHMARSAVASALDAVDGEARILLDPACGVGAFLLAAAEQGVPEIYGTDLDRTALAVAQVAVPDARLLEEDALRHGPPVDVVVGSPPFVPPHLQSAHLRREVRRRFPWLGRRFDLAVPFAATAVGRVRPGGAAGLVLPAPLCVQPHAAVLRRRWVQRHRVVDLSGPHAVPGTQTEVFFAILGVHQPTAPLPVYGMAPEEVLTLDNAPLDPDLMPGDAHLVRRIRAESLPLAELSTVDSGLVAYGPQTGGDVLIHREPAEGRVAYADADDFFSGRRDWLDYRPGSLHRSQSPELFEPPKIVLARHRGRGAIQAAIDTDGTYVGHTCTVVVPDSRVSLDQLLKLVRSPYIDAITRIERGRRVEPEPHEVARFPVPQRWLEDASLSIEAAFDLSREEQERLKALARAW